MTRIDSHITTPVEVERMIVELCSVLEEMAREIRTRALKAAECEAEYRKVKAAAFLEAKGTVGERDARATLAAQEEFLARKIADALLLSATSASRLYQSRLDGYRSLNTNVRQMAGLNQ